MSIPATQLRPGMIIKHNNDLHSVFSVEHRTPGNLRAFIQAKLRNLRTGAMFEHRFRSPDPIEKVNVDEVDMQFLYADGDSYYFMDTSNYEQTHLTKEVLGDAVDYLIANLEIKVEFFDGKAVGIELPQTVELTVVETEPGLKSATASSVTKWCRCPRSSMKARKSRLTPPKACICRGRKDECRFSTSDCRLETTVTAARILGRQLQIGNRQSVASTA
jgi:elongation factor P